MERFVFELTGEELRILLSGSWLERKSPTVAVRIHLRNLDWAYVYKLVEQAHREDDRE